MVELLRVAARRVRGGRASARASSFPVSLERRLEAGLAVGDHKTSMLQDLEAGKPLELDCLSGAVIEWRRSSASRCPNTRTVHACTALLDRVSRG